MNIVDGVAGFCPKGAIALAYLVACLVSEEARAEEDGSVGDPETSQDARFDLGLRLSVGKPYGSWAADEPMSNIVGFGIQPQVSLSYAVTDALLAGAYLGVGPGFSGDVLGDVCAESEVKCPQWYLNAGLQVERELFSHPLVRPWVAANLGLEWMKSSIQLGASNATWKGSGVAAGVSMGVDFQLGKLEIGPFASLQLGSYLNPQFDLRGIFDDGTAPYEGRVEDRNAHYWLGFGVRCQVRVGG